MHQGRRGGGCDDRRGGLASRRGAYVDVVAGDRATAVRGGCIPGEENLPVAWLRGEGGGAEGGPKVVSCTSGDGELGPAASSAITLKK